jgi:type 2 lantibiotic, mersacidin/lichenicidin family
MTRKTKNLTIRVWTDPAFRASLSGDELAALPPNPAGSSGIDEDDLSMAAGGWTFTNGCTSLGCDTSQENCTCQGLCSKTSCPLDVNCTDTITPGCSGLRS